MIRNGAFSFSNMQPQCATAHVKRRNYALRSSALVAKSMRPTEFALEGYQNVGSTKGVRALVKKNNTSDIVGGNQAAIHAWRHSVIGVKRTHKNTAFLGSFLVILYIFLKSASCDLHFASNPSFHSAVQQMALPVFNFIEKSQTVTRPTAIWRLIAIRIVCVCVYTHNLGIFIILLVFRARP